MTDDHYLTREDIDDHLDWRGDRNQGADHE
ncbi:hypothetical protein KNU54_gp56 [Gordonia phage VanDeWege]|uniref:Uncharacterized protein n=2 Tax=Wizardvirus TaxID=2169658 RepID=A0A4Y5TYW9_9CAUD|nr:hypothetical protein KNU54_gp56 [Gordonia phage VanDeWege]YP_010102400.1 hypothetical protein KNU57_gp55 [Gordonia phage Valary]QDB74638.1 hypothetical protein SEA_VANDEWEGE_56 [Gordonia phage VanDeWege]QDB74924.1 hypothetical protein SEA_VALARY_55 [Gordonia phage Valary]